MTSSTSNESRPILDNWAGHMNRDFQRTGRAIQRDLTQDRSCDCARQIFGAVLFGISCYPCSCVRLWRHCTGCADPVKIKYGEKDCVIPGLELCSTAECDCLADKGYGHNEYTRGQDDGSGMSRRTLDEINIAISTLWLSAIGLCIAAYA